MNDIVTEIRQTSDAPAPSAAAAPVPEPSRNQLLTWLLQVRLDKFSAGSQMEAMHRIERIVQDLERDEFMESNQTN